MTLHRITIQDVPIIIERRVFAPDVPYYMISLQSDPIMFPMVYKPEFGGWIFVDKMTIIEMKTIEKEISDFIEKLEVE